MKSKEETKPRKFEAPRGHTTPKIGSSEHHIKVLPQQNPGHSDNSTITYENIKRITIEKPKVKRDRRGGLYKLKEIIYFLRDFGFKEKQEIIYKDVKHAIMEVTQGTDPRTIKKHLNLLVEFAYLKPVGHPLAKKTQVTVRFNEKVSGKTYTSKKGNSSYVFGIMAPKRYAETVLNVESVPPEPPLPSVLEAVDNFDDLRLQREYDLENMLERIGVTSEKCVCASGETEGKEETEENGGEREKRERDTITHTYIETKPLFTRLRQKKTIKKARGPS